MENQSCGLKGGEKVEQAERDILKEKHHAVR